MVGIASIAEQIVTYQLSELVIYYYFWRQIMNTLLQVDFDYSGPFDSEMASMLKALAESINHEPGLIWKIWTESETEHLGGGIYLFEDEKSASAYLTMHSARLSQMGIENIRGRIFAVNTALSAINNGPIG